MTLYSLFKERKFLFISLLFHIIVICAVIITIHFWRAAPKENVIIQEVELFTPEPQTTPVNSPPITEEKPIVPPPQKAEIPAKKTIHTPPPEPLRSDLKNQIMKKWDTIEKKNR